MNNFKLMQELRKHTVEGPGCWKWTGQLSPKGYGRVRTGGLDLRANRVSYQVYVGEIPSGMMVCHSCDNPECTNPTHLFLGTAKDNMSDRISKNRYHPHRCADGTFAKN